MCVSSSHDQGHTNLFKFSLISCMMKKSRKSSKLNVDSSCQVKNELADPLVSFVRTLGATLPQPSALDTAYLHPDRAKDTVDTMKASGKSLNHHL